MQIQTMWGFGTKETMARKGGRGYERDLQLKQWRQRGQMRNECLIYQGRVIKSVRAERSGCMTLNLKVIDQGR